MTTDGTRGLSTSHVRTVGRPIDAWCGGEFRAGRGDAFAVATTAEKEGGRYLVLEPDGTVTVLASFTHAAGLACYSRTEADAFNDTLEATATVHGRITPRWETAVICAFVDGTTAVCWQHSPADDAFVEVGGWIT